MRGGSRLSLVVGALATLVVGALPSTGAVHASPASSQSRRSALEAQLHALAGPQAAAAATLLAAEQALQTVQSQLLATRHRLADLDRRLLTLSRQVTDDTHTIAAAKVDLGALVRATYQQSSGTGIAGAILASNDFSQAMDRIREAQHLAAEVQDLQHRLADREAAIIRERSAVLADGAQAQAMEASLAAESNRMTALVVARDAALQALTGQARSIAVQIAALDQPAATPAAPARTSAPTAPAPPPVHGGGSCGNHFAFGYCTWYVATRRCVPWFGNAWQWWGAAAAAGYAEGRTPQAGAIAVWGQGGYSPEGHVAYVEAVGPASGVPAGSFLISEMNFSGGWDRVDYRVVPDGSPWLLGFIY